MSTMEGMLFLTDLGKEMAKKGKSVEGQDKKSMDLFGNEGMVRMMSGFTLKRLLSMAGTMRMEPFTREEILEINHKLNQIRKK